MMKLDGVSVFVAVAEAGSISGAAQRLGRPKSVVSERLAELERELASRLVQRNSRRLTL
ncbi:LysR family transcriptional regulator, partial [Rhizobiaceae sp. 2RAB30]